MGDEKQDFAELTDIERSAIGEICDLMTASLAKAFGEKLDSHVAMDSSSVNVMEFSEVTGSVAAPVLLVQLNCTAGLDGQLFLFILGDGLPGVFDLAIPEDAKEVGADDEVILENLKEMVSSAVCEAMVTFAGSMGQVIGCSVIDTVIMQDEAGFESIGFLYPEGKLLHVSADLTLPNGLVSAGYLMPLGLSNQIIELLLNEQIPEESSSPELLSVEDNITSVDNISFETVEQSPQVQDLRTARFGLIDGPADAESEPSNISLLLDVALDASIELGKTQMTIAEILKLGRGSVIELDKLASEPVEFLVNGKVIARGEVVVIDDNFGIRITEILSPKARLEQI